MVNQHSWEFNEENKNPAIKIHKHELHLQYLYMGNPLFFISFNSLRCPQTWLGNHPTRRGLVISRQLRSKVGNGSPFLTHMRVSISGTLKMVGLQWKSQLKWMI